MVGFFFTVPTSVTKSLSYSDFLKMVRTDQVAAVVIEEHSIVQRGSEALGHTLQVPPRNTTW
jgi:hypothetical protein